MKALDSTTYEHPLDKKSLGALKKIPLLDKLCTWIINFQIKTDYLSQYKGNSIMVTEKLSPRVYRLKKLAEERLCMNQDIPMFITLDWNYNAFTAGVDKPIIVLNSSVVENFSDDELLYIIGHEMGHIKSKHMLYHWMANNIASWMFNNSIISGAALLGLIVALKEWHRKSELTADRAGYIACKNKEAAITGMMRLMGVPADYENSVDWNISAEDILEQYKGYKEVTQDSIYMKLIYCYITSSLSHPWMIERINEINEWELTVE